MAGQQLISFVVAVVVEFLCASRTGVLIFDKRTFIAGSSKTHRSQWYLCTTINANFACCERVYVGRARVCVHALRLFGGRERRSLTQPQAQVYLYRVEPSRVCSHSLYSSTRILLGNNVCMRMIL